LSIQIPNNKQEKFFLIKKKDIGLNKDETCRLTVATKTRRMELFAISLDGNSRLFIEGQKYENG